MAAFKRGAIIGFAAGYVLGAKAGRDRYEQINKAWKRFKRTESYARLSAKFGAIIGLGLNRSKVIVLDSITKATHKAKDRIEHNGR